MERERERERERENTTEKKSKVNILDENLSQHAIQHLPREVFEFHLHLRMLIFNSKTTIFMAFMKP